MHARRVGLRCEPLYDRGSRRTSHAGIGWRCRRRLGMKSLLLGGAAAIVAVGGAQAADLPVKAKPVEYVKVCSLYGAGFWYVPGTDTCLKICSYVRVQTEFNNTTSDVPNGMGGGGNNAVAGREPRTDTANFDF